MEPQPPQPRVVFLHDNASYTLAYQRPLTFGRSQQGCVEGAQHVRLAHRELASHHCQIGWDGSTLTFVPLQQELPCYVNGMVTVQSVVVDHGDVLTFGPFNVEIDASAQQTPGESEPVLEAASIGEISLDHGLTIGNGARCRVALDGEEFADYPDGAFQVLIERNADGFHIQDLGTEPTWLNGQLFSSEDLIIGDYLQIGTRSLRFDGRSFLGVVRTLGSELEAAAVSKSYGSTHVLKEANFKAPAGQFIGILGPSGHGKTTMLKVISGLEPPESGQVLVNGCDLFENLEHNRTLMGYVPQDDIVHGELTVWEALEYSAYLRLPDWTSKAEIRKLIARVLGDLGLYRPDRNIDHTSKRITELSGGQRKRVSVAVELLNRPQILFLDEPTSGLDPGMEFELMSTLRSLTQSGCTVICTTHVLENVFLMDSIAFIYQGHRIFQGDSTRARSHFGLDRLSEVYTKLDDHGTDWLKSSYPPPSAPPVAQRADDLESNERKSALRAIRHLLGRHWALLTSDRKNVVLLFIQPLVIGLLITLAAVTEGAAITKLFLAHVATFWFGCSNAAQEIVKERAIFTREKFVGLSINAYLLGKGLALGGIACLQALLLYGVLFFNIHNGEKLPGSWQWQAAAVLLTALTSTSIGLAVSSWAKRQAQAVLLVPLIIIPQILLAGYVFPLKIWRPDETSAGNPLIQDSVYWLSAITPSGASQKIMDTSYFWERDPHDPAVPSNGETVRDNLSLGDSTQAPYKDPTRAKGGIAVLLLWSLGSYGYAWSQLRRA